MTFSFVIFLFPDVLSSIGKCVGAMTMFLAVLEFPDILFSIGKNEGALKATVRRVVENLLKLGHGDLVLYLHLDVLAPQLQRQELPDGTGTRYGTGRPRRVRGMWGPGRQDVVGYGLVHDDEPVPKCYLRRKKDEKHEFCGDEPSDCFAHLLLSVQI